MKVINLVLDSDFENLKKQSWIMDDCAYKVENNALSLISKSKVFGMHQTINVNANSRIYFRFLFRCKRFLSKVTIGIKIGSTLHALNTDCVLNIDKSLSIVTDVKEQSNITLFIICESNSISNNILISKPFALDLTALNMMFTLKSDLDKIKYKKSLKYKNILSDYNFSNTYNNLSNWSLSNEDNRNKIIVANNKVILETYSASSFLLKKNLEIQHTYLLKISVNNLNLNGFIELKYNHELFKEINNQIYLIFKATKYRQLQINIFQNTFYEIPYLLAIDKIILIDLTEDKLLNLTEEEIFNLNYVS